MERGVHSHIIIFKSFINKYSIIKMFPSCYTMSFCIIPYVKSEPSSPFPKFFVSNQTLDVLHIHTRGVSNLFPFAFRSLPFHHKRCLFMKFRYRTLPSRNGQGGVCPMCVCVVCVCTCGCVCRLGTSLRKGKETDLMRRMTNGVNLGCPGHYRL